MESGRRNPQALRALILAAVTLLIPLVSAATAAAAVGALTFSSDTTNAYYTLTYTGGAPTFLRVLFDTDQNPATGYPIDGIGADYLVENSILYRYSGTNGSWAWTTVAPVTDTTASGVASWTIPLTDIGSPNHLNVIGNDDDSNGVNYYTVAQTQLIVLSVTTPPNSLNLLSGSYSGCVNGVGSGCAKGDYRSDSNATVSASSSTLTTSTGNFTSGDVGKKGIALQLNGTPYVCSTPYSGWGCWNGYSCEFTVASINSSNSINVTKGAGCGSSGIGFNSSSNAYWALYTDDTSALVNAVTAAQNTAVPLYVPANYKGGIGGSPNFYNGFNLQCASGATFYNPHLTGAPYLPFSNVQTWIMRILGGSGYTINGCTLSGTEPPNSAWMDINREWDLGIIIDKASNVSFTHNIVKNIWGTEAVGTSGATNVVIDSSVFQNCEYYGVQFAEVGGSSAVTNNTFTDCSYGSEDDNGYPAGIDKYQTIQGNTIQVGPNGGTGYNKTQSSLGLGSSGSVMMACGLACDGTCTNTSQYVGVTCSNDTVSGPTSVIYGPPGGSFLNGAIETGNTCINGCSYR
jgi:hypothetical protein